MVPDKQRENRIILAGDLCINSLTIGSWNAAEKYLRRERARKKRFKDGDRPKALGTNQSSWPGERTRVLAYGTTGEPKKEGQKWIKFFAC
jgi:hypothetical protein